MQSTLQYRRLRRQLERQIEQQGLEATAGVQNGPPRRDVQDKILGVMSTVGDGRGDQIVQSIAPHSISANEKPLSSTYSPERPYATSPGDFERGDVGERLLIVGFTGPDDPLNPQNWPLTKKWLYTLLVGSTGLLASGAAAFDTAITPQAAATFHVSQEVELLNTALYMIAFGLGSLVSAPFSETVGRNPVYIVSLTIFALFTMGAGMASNIQSQLVCRFFAGFFGCPPLTTFGGSSSDLWTALDRTYVFPLLSVLTFLSPFLAPTAADFIATSPALAPLGGWRWTEWVTLIFAGTIILALFLFMPETYPPVLLAWKAKHLRAITGDERYKAPIELTPMNLATRLARSVVRPIKFLLTEPIVDLFSLYLVIMYIILFGLLPGYDYIFGERGIYGFDQQHTGLCFIGMNVGFLIAMIPIRPLFLRFRQKLYEAKERGEGKVLPEERLWFAMMGAPPMTISIFWMGWSSWPSVSFWSPLVASAFFGFGTLAVFISCYQYIIDTFEVYAASALVGMTVTRYCVAGPMVIVSVPMYENLGVHWALTLVGCLSALMTPVPFIFYRYGAAIRRKSPSATKFEH